MTEKDNEIALMKISSENVRFFQSSNINYIKSEQKASISDIEQLLPGVRLTGYIDVNHVT